jgi:hypothetical protein
MWLSVSIGINLRHQQPHEGEEIYHLYMSVKEFKKGVDTLMNRRWRFPIRELVLAAVTSVTIGTCPERLPGPEDFAKAPPFPFADRWSGGYPEMMGKIQEFTDIVHLLLHPSINLFAKFEGRYPESIGDLCGTPYLPVDCGVFVSPLDGKRMDQLKPGQLGAVEFVREGSGDDARLVLRPYFLNPATGVADSHQATHLRMLPLKAFAVSRGRPLWDKSGASPQLIRLYALRSVLQAISNDYQSCRKHRGPWSLSDIRDRYPLLRFLRDGSERPVAIEEGAKSVAGLRVAFDSVRGAFEVTWDGTPIKEVIERSQRAR